MNKQQLKEAINALYEIAGDAINSESQREWRQERAGVVYRCLTDHDARLEKAVRLALDMARQKGGFIYDFTPNEILATVKKELSK